MEFAMFQPFVFSRQQTGEKKYLPFHSQPITICLSSSFNKHVKGQVTKSTLSGLRKKPEQKLGDEEMRCHNFLNLGFSPSNL